MKVFKYPLNIGGETIVPLPVDAKRLCVHWQEEVSGHPHTGRPVLWAIVEGPVAEDHTFLVMPTGKNLPEGKSLDYVGCVFTDAVASYVFHVFEVGLEKE